MHPHQLRHTYMQCGAETDRRAQPAHRTEHLFRQQARHRHLHSQALGRWLSALVAAAVEPAK